MYQRALNIDPKHVVTLCNMGLLLHDVRREYDEALAVFERAMEAASDADDVLVHHLVAANAEAESARAKDDKADAMRLPPIFSKQEANQGILQTEMAALRQRQGCHYLEHLTKVLKDDGPAPHTQPPSAKPLAETHEAAAAAVAAGEHEGDAAAGASQGAAGGEGPSEHGTEEPAPPAGAEHRPAGDTSGPGGTGGAKYVGTLMRQKLREKEEDMRKKRVVVTAMVLKSATLQLRAADGIGGAAEKRILHASKFNEYYVVLKHAYLYYYHNMDVYVNNASEVRRRQQAAKLPPATSTPAALRVRVLPAAFLIVRGFYQKWRCRNEKQRAQCVGGAARGEQRG